MAHQTLRTRRSRAARMFSTILFIAAIGFGAAAAYVWYTDDGNEGPGTPPPAVNAADIDLAQVLRVLQESDDGWDYSRSPASARSEVLGVGQHLQLGDSDLFVFIFTGGSSQDRIAARQAAGEQVDLDTMQLTTTSGRVVNDAGQPLYQAEHSNVITILVGGDQQLASQVDEALANLP